MNDLDLDAIEARYTKAHFVDMESFMQLAFQIGLDITALIAEVRRLRNHIAMISPNKVDSLQQFKNGVIAAMLDKEIEAVSVPIENKSPEWYVTSYQEALGEIDRLKGKIAKLEDDLAYYEQQEEE